ncbi:MAG: ABC transporter substrate-binding protein [Pasteurellaceae bacterium]|nr:ABC transporter substrate-binding protein [Pasteurellaceae bacterium]
MATQWSCLVDNQGNCLEWEDEQGKTYLTQFEPLIGYAQGLIISSLDKVGFYYFVSADHQWFYVSVTRHKQDFALLQIKTVNLPLELSHRELEILTLLSSGLSNADIAEQLYISERTVAKHVQHLFEKTAMENRTLLAVFAMRENLFCLPTPSDKEYRVLPCQEIEAFAKSISLSRTLPTSEKSFCIQTFQQRPIKIGVPYVEQGIGQIDTQELINGSRLAVETINQQGGIHGRQLELVTAGFRFDSPHSIQQAYQQLFDQEVDAISTSYACYSPEIHELVAQSGIPYLHLATHSQSNKKAQNLAVEQIKNIFQVCASDENYGLGVLRFLAEYQHYYPEWVKSKRILVIRVKWQPIDIGIDRLIFRLRQQNWSVEVVELEKKGDPFEAVMPLIHNLDPALIVLASYFAEDVIAFYQQFIQQPLNAILYSIYAPSALLPHQQLCEGMLWASTTALSKNYAGQQFCQQYQQFFNHQPSYSQASVAYDQVQILANVWRESLSPRNFKEVLTGLRTLPYHGVNGNYYFAEENQTGLTYPDNTMDLSISQPHLIFQVQQGISKVIAPQLFAESRFQLPMWFNKR